MSSFCHRHVTFTVQLGDLCTMTSSRQQIQPGTGLAKWGEYLLYTCLLFYSPPTEKIKSVKRHHRRVWLLECTADSGSSVETLHHVIQIKHRRKRLLVPILKSVRNSIQCSLLQLAENWGMSYGIQVFVELLDFFFSCLDITEPFKSLEDLGSLEQLSTK